MDQRPELRAPSPESWAGSRWMARNQNWARSNRLVRAFLHFMAVGGLCKMDQLLWKRLMIPLRGRA